MQETPRRSTRALFASKGDAVGSGGAATPCGDRTGLVYVDASVLGSPSTAFGFPTSAQQQHRFRRGALFNAPPSGASGGDAVACGRGADPSEGGATLQAAFRGAARVTRRAKTVPAVSTCVPEAQERSGGARCGVSAGRPAVCPCQGTVS